MILPFISGVFSFRLAPITWSLFAIQFLVYLYSFSPSVEKQGELEGVFNDPVFTEFQGRMFAAFVLSGENEYSDDIKNLSLQTLRNMDPDKAQVLGNLAFRDLAFVKAADTFENFQDPVIFSWWKSKFKIVQDYRESHPSYVFGVSDEGQDLFTWLSYQFAHSGSVHFLSNMIFMLIFGSALEILIGGLGVLVVFLGSGLVAAGVFLLMEPPSAVPLIGASGAVSGLMALFACLYWRRGIRFIYFLLIPKRGYFGFVYLPGWAILFLWALSDVAGYIATPKALGGVAHSAHLGGELAGILIGVTVYFTGKFFRPGHRFKSALIDEKPVFTTVT